ncbi:MAG TPA: hypothetical protein VMU84_13845 [Thermoanaerobaculia bacterium]|nr:hypothetical protein [Thermoanaerobaculia bacterium]
MDRFPEEFEDLLNARGRKFIANPVPVEALRARGRTPIALIENFIDKGVARESIRLLDAAIYPALRRMHSPIPREALTRMRKNYEEKLPKTVRVKTMTMNSPGTKSLAISREIGLAQMMGSKSFKRFAEGLVGAPLTDENHGRQVICYGAGDYSGPHNDHHPEQPEAKNGFIDLHVMFSNEAVASQWLVYEERGYLSSGHDVSGTCGIAVYRLPFWHYTTPLVARRGREKEARRWLLLGSFDYETPLPKLVYR